MSSSVECVCYRESKTILCLNCKILSGGRIQITCPIHKNVTFLFDYHQCPNCKAPSNNLKEIDVDFPTIKTAIQVTMSKGLISKMPEMDM